MNYRHAFHAGNFGDCVKHALLVWLLRAMARKPAGFCVLDTHAGRGRYALAEGPAERTGEWRAGILPLLDDPPAALADYVGLVRQLDAGAHPSPGPQAEGEKLHTYPGSPALAQALLRPQDRLVCCELHPEDHAALKRKFPGVEVHRRDAWEALGALLPPRERRGLVLIDPPYEMPDEFSRVSAGLCAGHVRFPTGVFAAWYPIKHRGPVRRFHTALAESGMRDIVAAELWLREPLDAGRLNGCGLAVINPPFGFTEAAPPILDALLSRFATEAGAGTALDRLVDE